MSTRQLTRREIESLPPVITLARLAQALGVSEPTIRAAHRGGELARLGIRVNRIGAQHRVVTASVWACLGLGGCASPVPADGNGAGQDRPATPPMRPSAGRRTGSNLTGLGPAELSSLPPRQEPAPAEPVADGPAVPADQVGEEVGPATDGVTGKLAASIGGRPTLPDVDDVVDMLSAAIDGVPDVDEAAGAVFRELAAGSLDPAAAARAVREAVRVVLAGQQPPATPPAAADEGGAG